MRWIPHHAIDRSVCQGACHGTSCSDKTTDGFGPLFSVSIGIGSEAPPSWLRRPSEPEIAIVAMERGRLWMENCGSRLFLSLPDDVLALISDHLHPADLCALSLCCRGLRPAIAASEKVWLAQCRRLSPPPHALPLWREGVRSYRALCRFLAAVAPLLGVWVHQNPELGNVVCVLWGFLSVVGVRVIPQELGPLGLDEGPLLWAPVFEILADDDGSPSCFFLHGRGENGEESLFPGSIGSIDSSCNILLLEVEARRKETGFHQSWIFSSIADSKDPTFVRRLRRCDTNTVSAPAAALLPPPLIPFARLPFSDRRGLLDRVAGRVALDVPPDLTAAPLFDRCDNAEQLAHRRSVIVKMHKQLNGGRIDWKDYQLEERSAQHKSAANGDELHHHYKRNALFSVAAYFRDGFKQFIARSNPRDLTSHKKHPPLHQFLMPGDSLGLSLRAAHMRLTTYRAWPDMHDNWFALYKLRMPIPTAGHELAGLWGGTFGWPPARPSQDKPGKALFFLRLTYEEEEGRPLLVATKLLEGTHYVLHPNGSAMFVAKVDEASSDAFPWDNDGEMEVKQSYTGEGIAGGYGFRYPGCKPGALFVLQNGLLAFVWKESKSVLMLQRIDLPELLKKGERVATLPPVANFCYLTKSYSNVFVGVHNSSSSNGSCIHHAI
ncbi:F-box protein At5g39450-like [Zingiber officinale]|uniref:F-box protein At5g39450-like n=1 Tax=Zingiber officinale TaxID=94328 RepID=UPI001C4D1756|nr:F-box protein At5g39450-like [Zingiber officinale]XP_042382624.1 F-box protein At5g39450-like [Zingiber officinale]XP_042382625.1 F-box protein At5g39450-like [Zingiber officinale]XP_042382626.1 F-box protein At5g39450-like [Zingiber officinale]XP_042382627.1 F-box protein At5g39450-like [Zingiber officinale]XP_042382628.1 F-box protein At5g39450-like [Zingiber officinale]XP_042382629.1 F-box protein At5g39450-like [Zingiber officinale]